MLTTRFVNGAPDWIDVGTSDLDRTVAFYGGLLGWRFRPAGPDAGGYGFFQLDGRTVAGGMPAQSGQDPTPWTVYFRSADAGATATAAEEAHGSVLHAPTDIMGEGVVAVLADRAGARFGVWQPGRTPGVEVASEPGSLCWTELYTPDVAAAAAFYHHTLGLETSAVPFPGGAYTCVNPAEGGDEAMFGGIVPVTVEGDATGPAAAYWLPYFEVEDPDAVAARAGELGGGVQEPARTLEGVGRTARLTDPDGAGFAVIRSAAPEE